MWGMYILEIIFGSLFAVCLILIIFGVICNEIYNRDKIYDKYGKNIKKVR